MWTCLHDGPMPTTLQFAFESRAFGMSCILYRLTHLASFFLDQRAKWSTTNSCFIFYSVTPSFIFHFTPLLMLTPIHYQHEQNLSRYYIKYNGTNLRRRSRGSERISIHGRHTEANTGIYEAYRQGDCESSSKNGGHYELLEQTIPRKRTNNLRGTDQTDCDLCT